MPLGLALVVIFILYLVDKHHLWRQTFKGTLWFALVGAVLAVSVYGWMSWDAYRTEKRTALKIVSSTSASDDSKIDLSAGLVRRPAWIYVDIFEQVDGIPVPPPKAPSQIAEMIKKNADCVPGSITYGTDKVEWICVQPEDFPKGTSGAISIPIPQDATIDPTDACDPNKDPFTRFGGRREGCPAVK